LECAHDEAKKQHEPTYFPLKTPLNGKRVLYLENEPGLRIVISELLRVHGCSVETARDGIDGLGKFSSSGTGFDIVITDLEMPNIGGISFIGLLRKTGFAGVIAVFSGTVTPQRAEELRSLSVDAVISKLAATENFIAELERVVGGGNVGGESPPRPAPSPLV
jgi:CheY-like chemotaxis protein